MDHITRRAFLGGVGAVATGVAVSSTAGVAVGLKPIVEIPARTLQQIAPMILEILDDDGLWQPALALCRSEVSKTLPLPVEIDQGFRLAPDLPEYKYEFEGYSPEPFSVNLERAYEGIESRCFQFSLLDKALRFRAFIAEMNLVGDCDGSIKAEVFCQGDGGLRVFNL